MDFEKFLKDTKAKYQPEQMEIQYTPCSNCKTPMTKYCIECGKCGREFKDGKLIREYNGELVND